MADPDNTLVLETTKGRVVIEMRPDLAPKHVEQIKKLARQGGMATMYEVGIAKALRGETTIEEVLRVTEDA